MEKQIETLYQAFNKMNETFFNNQVPVPTITIQSRGKARAYGWCSVNPIWNGNDGKTRELNVSAEYANHPFADIMGTMLHEMVHLANLAQGIRDTSRHQYHNKRFAVLAEAVGLEVSQSKEYGFAHTKLKPETLEIIEGWGLDTEVFHKARIDFENPLPSSSGKKGAESEGNDALPPKPPKKKSSSIKWVCGCGTIIRSTKPEINVICGDCGSKFEKVEK